MTVNSSKLANEIWLEIKLNRRIRNWSLRFADEVQDHWANVEAVSPDNPNPTSKEHYSKGGYKESIHVERRPDRFGLPHYWVGTRHRNANFIEFGTGPDKPGSHSPWGPITPTPEMAPAAKTAAHFLTARERKRELRYGG